MIQIGVIGASLADEPTVRLAEEIGRGIALRGWVVVCGGLGGVMEAAARGAAEAGGLTVGILPGPETSAANRFIRVAVATDLGHARNAVIARTADALVAVGGGYGTLSEIALARTMGKPVVSVHSWRVAEGIEIAGDSASALTLLERAVKARGPAGT